MTQRLYLARLAGSPSGLREPKDRLHGSSQGTGRRGENERCGFARDRDDRFADRVNIKTSDAPGTCVCGHVLEGEAGVTRHVIILLVGAVLA